MPPREKERDMEMEQEGGKKKLGRRKLCKFCSDEKIKIDYKDAGLLKYFITDRGKLVPRRLSGNCAKHQREVAKAIKRSRGLALIPYLVLAG